MSLDEFTITLAEKDGRLSVEALTKALENAIDMLHGIEASILTPEIAVRWEVVRATMQSPLQLTFSPRVTRRGKLSRPEGRRLVKSVVQGLAGIESGKNIPRNFSDETIDATRKLVKSAGNAGVFITVGSESRPTISLTEKTIQHLDELSAKARLYVEYSTIEGRLEVISVHGRNSFSVWEGLTNQRVECFVDDKSFPTVATFLGRRVAVTGRVHYRNHVPKSIHVEEPIKALRESNALPQPSDIGPINITDGLSSEEHVQRLRNA